MPKFSGANRLRHATPAARAVLAGCAVLVLTTGCSGSEGGGAVTPAATPDTAPGTSPRARYPRQVDVRATSPCALLTAEAKRRLFDAQSPHTDVVTVKETHAPRCTWLDGAGGHASITVAAGVTIDEVVNDATVTGIVPLDGFAATLLSGERNGTPGCTAAIDIAAGDVILVAVDGAGRSAATSGPSPDPQVMECDRATSTAAHVVGYFLDR